MSTTVDVSTSAASLSNNVSGRQWKQPKTATKRTQGKKFKSKSWDDRMAERKKQDQVKKLEREIKAEKAAEVQRFARLGNVATEHGLTCQFSQSQRYHSSEESYRV